MKKTEEKKSTEQKYAYYSFVLQEPFTTLEELTEAEEAHYAKLAAKEAKVAEKKSDATKVEEAFKALNAARKAYKENLATLHKMYRENLKLLKKALEEDTAAENNILAEAEKTYADALKAFADKYPEGYHITLKDGDFETTISHETTKSQEPEQAWSEDTLRKLFSLFF
jgi:chromosome segregation ATPase